MKRLLSYIIVFFFALLVQHVNAQSKAELEKQKKEREREIALTNTLIQEISSSSKNSIKKLNLLGRKIEALNDLVNIYSNERDSLIREREMISEKLRYLEGEKKVKNKNLESLKQEYKNLLLYVAKHRNSDDKLIFIFSSEDYNQAYKRLKYLNYYIFLSYTLLMIYTTVMNKTIYRKKISKRKNPNTDRRRRIWKEKKRTRQAYIQN
jgi:hypothetical protein